MTKRPLLLSIIIKVFYNVNEKREIMEYIFLIIGFVLLIKGADIFVEGSISVSRKLHIPSIIIGLTIVAMGTSAPEAAVSIAAVMQESGGIAVGNIIGSNIFNLLMVVGVCSVILPVTVDKSILEKEYPLSIIAAVGLLLLCMGSFFVEPTKLLQEVGILSRLDGIILLVGMVGFMVYTVLRAILEREADQQVYGTISTTKTIIFIVVGIAAVIFGGKLVVDSGKAIAQSFGLSDSIIGLTIVAIGTSLPELVTSISAARKGESDIALGNVIGSNIFNTLFILGITATIKPVSVNGFTVIDMIIAVVFSIYVFLLARRQKIGRVGGSSMIIMYVLFTAYLIIRQVNFGY